MITYSRYEDEEVPDFTNVDPEELEFEDWVR